MPSAIKSAIKNASWLSVAYLAGYLVPLLELPILARALGPSTYGAVLFAQSLAMSLSLVVEYGFNLSASRQLAQHKDDKVFVKRLFGNVLLAKLLLSGFLAILVAIWWMFSKGGAAGITVELAVAALILFVALGFNPFWYFQGVEKMSGPVLFELAFRLVGIAGLYVFINAPSDAPYALGIMAAMGLCNAILTTVWALHLVGLPLFSLRGALSQIRDGWNVFIYKSSSGILLRSSPVILGIAAGPLATGIFVPAEKLVRAATGLAIPVLTAFFPHFSRLSGTDNAGADRQAWLLVAVLTGGSVLGAVVLWWVSPWLIPLFVGDEFESTMHLLGFFAWLIPLRVLSQSLGLAIIIPRGNDRVAGYALVASAVLAAITGFLFSGAYGAAGMISALLLAECALVIALLVCIKLRKVQPCSQTG